MPYFVIQGFGLNPLEVFKPDRVKKYIKATSNDRDIDGNKYFKYTWSRACDFWTNLKQLQYPYLSDLYKDADFQLFHGQPLQGPSTLIYMENPAIGYEEARFMSYNRAEYRLAMLLNNIVSAYYDVDGKYIHVPGIHDIIAYLDWYCETYDYRLINQTVITK